MNPEKEEKEKETVKQKCYYFSEEEKTWDESEASCRLLGSHLAKIDSREEQVCIT